LIACSLPLLIWLSDGLLVHLLLHLLGPLILLGLLRHDPLMLLHAGHCALGAVGILHKQAHLKEVLGVFVENLLVDIRLPQVLQLLSHLCVFRHGLS